MNVLTTGVRHLFTTKAEASLCNPSRLLNSRKMLSSSKNKTYFVPLVCKCLRRCDTPRMFPEGCLLLQFHPNRLVNGNLGFSFLILVTVSFSPPRDTEQKALKSMLVKNGNSLIGERLGIYLFFWQKSRDQDLLGNKGQLHVNLIRLLVWQGHVHANYFYLFLKLHDNWERLVSNIPHQLPTKPAHFCISV